jgi:hypothetical protein
MKNVIENRKAGPLVLKEFDEELWIAVVESVTVLADGVMIFRLGMRRRLGRISTSCSSDFKL